MNKRKRIISIAVMAVLALGLAFGMEALQVKTQVKEPEGYITVREAGEFDLEKCELTDAEYKKEAISAQDGSEILYDLGEDTEVPALKIYSKKHLKAEVPITVYYAADGEEFSEERSVSFIADPGADVWNAGVPAGTYRRFRIVMGGKMTIKSVVYSEAVTERQWIEEGLHMRRVWIMWPLLFLGMLLLAGLHAGRRIAGVCTRAWKGLSADWKRTVLGLVTFAAAGTAGFFAARLHFGGSFAAELTLPRTVFFAACGIAAGSLVTFRKTLGIKPENLFVIICLCAGLIMAVSFNTLVGWDEAFHYDEAINCSYLGDERMSQAEYKMIIASLEIDQEEKFLSAETRGEWLEEIQELHDEGAELVQSKALDTKHYFEFFPGIGLYLGRVLGLPYYAVFCVGKIFGLLAYTVCGYYAIRRLKSGKMIAAVCMLIPSAVFTASVYSYDTGLNAFATLGLAWMFGEWQRADKKVTWKDTAIMLGSIFFGCLAKAVYFPMMMLGMLLPGSKFAKKSEKTSRGQITRGMFIAVTILMIILLAATFMVPMLTGGTESDDRNGGDVDAYGQISFILEDPMWYAGILLDHLKGYLRIGRASQVISLFAYLGTARYTTVLIVLLLFTAFTDKKRNDRLLGRNIPARLLSLLFLFGTVVLISTSMYIVYTPVGQTTFDGVQPRYLLPIIFPTLMLAGSGLLGEWLKIDRPWKQSLYNGIVLAVSTFVLYNGVFQKCVSRFIS